MWEHLQLCPMHVYYITIPDSAELNTNIQQCVYIFGQFYKCNVCFRYLRYYLEASGCPPSSSKWGRSGNVCTIKVEILNNSWDTRLSWLWGISCCLLFESWQQYYYIYAIDKKYICSIWLWYSQWFNFAFVYEEIWIYVIMPSCMTGVIWSQYGPNLKRWPRQLSGIVWGYSIHPNIYRHVACIPGHKYANSCMIQWPGIYFFVIRFQRWF